MHRTIILLLAGVITLSIALFFVNIWVSEEDSGVFLTQDTYMGTITWYEDSQTPPAPSSFNKTTPLIAVNDNTAVDSMKDTETTTGLKEIHDILKTTTAAAPINNTVAPVAPSSVKAPIKTPPRAQAKVMPPKETVAKAPKNTIKDKAVATPVKKDTVRQVPARKILEQAFLTKDAVRPVRIEANVPVEFKAFYLVNPDRIVIDIKGILEIPNAEAFILPKNAYVKSMRIAYNANNTRIVVDLFKKPKKWSVLHGKRKSSLDISIVN